MLQNGWLHTQLGHCLEYHHFSFAAAAAKRWSPKVLSGTLLLPEEGSFSRARHSGQGACKSTCLKFCSFATPAKSLCQRSSPVSPHMQCLSLERHSVVQNRPEWFTTSAASVNTASKIKYTKISKEEVSGGEGQGRRRQQGHLPQETHGFALNQNAAGNRITCPLIYNRTASFLIFASVLLPPSNFKI